MVIRVIEIYFIIEFLLSIFAMSRIWQAAVSLNCGLLHPSAWGCFYELGGGDYIVRAVTMVILGFLLDYAHHKQEPGNTTETQAAIEKEFERWEKEKMKNRDEGVK